MKARGYGTFSFLIAATVAMPMALGDHTHEDTGASFDHVGGNAWWVEVVVDHGGVPDQVQAQDTGDPTWHELEFKPWGEWGGSFQIEPGHQVRFRSLQDGSEATSCWFTHPEGVEQCDDGGDFKASFDTPGGNDWWVEVYVTANQPLAGVDARANGGAWQTLELRSWGAWAKSFHVPDGSIVEFRAHSTTGDTAMSGGFRWPSGDPVTLFDAAFGPKASNQWWVETYAISADDIVGVDARSNGGAWHMLELKEWGAWAASFHVPDGSTVEFRAHAGDGQSDVGVGFLWPDAVPVDDAGAPWPQEGSYVRYDLLDTDPAPSERHVDITFVHHDGRWLAQCEGTQETPGGPGEIDEFRETDPPFAPTEVAPGERVVVEGVTVQCEKATLDPDVQGAGTYDTHHEGDAVTIVTWEAGRLDDCKCLSFEAEWEQETGLVAFWDRSGRSTWRGNLQDTDAPITG